MNSCSPAFVPGYCSRSPSLLSVLQLCCAPCSCSPPRTPGLLSISQFLRGDAVWGGDLFKIQALGVLKGFQLLWNLIFFWMFECFLRIWPNLVRFPWGGEKEYSVKKSVHVLKFEVRFGEWEFSGIFLNRGTRVSKSESFFCPHLKNCWSPTAPNFRIAGSQACSREISSKRLKLLWYSTQQNVLCRL